MALNAAPAGMPALVLQQAAAHAGTTILRRKHRGLWQSVSWGQLAARMRCVAAALQADGLQRGEVAAVLAETRPEWAVADLGIQAAGGVSMGIPPDADADRLARTLRETGCRAVFVENEEQLDKVLEVRAACPTLRRVVIFDMKGLRDFADAGCESFAGLVQRGEQRTAQAPDCIAPVAGDDPALLLVGPDGAGQRLTHDDVKGEIAAAHASLGARSGDERMALLPMSDAMERVYGLYYALHTGTISNFLESPDTGMENMQEVQPTLLGADAALWRMLHARAAQAGAAATPVQRTLYRWADSAARHGGPAAALARALVLQRVRRELGLGRVRIAYVGDPLAPDVAAWAERLGIGVRRVGMQAMRPAVPSGPALAMAVGV